MEETSLKFRCEQKEMLLNALLKTKIAMQVR